MINNLVKQTSKQIEETKEVEKKGASRMTKEKQSEATATAMITEEVKQNTAEQNFKSHRNRVREHKNKRVMSHTAQLNILQSSSIKKDPKKTKQSRRGRRLPSASSGGINSTKGQGADSNKSIEKKD